MKELHLEKEITLEELTEHWFKIRDPYVADDNKAIDFEFPCSDWFAIFSEQFKSIEEFHTWLDNDDYQMNSNLLYYPNINQLMIVLEFCEEEYTYSYITIKDGPGKEMLIKQCEICCQEEYGLSFKEFLSNV